jgi:hypothetical protein
MDAIGNNGLTPVSGDATTVAKTPPTGSAFSRVTKRTTMNTTLEYRTKRRGTNSPDAAKRQQGQHS